MCFSGSELKNKFYHRNVEEGVTLSSSSLCIYFYNIFKYYNIITLLPLPFPHPIPSMHPPLTLFQMHGPFFFSFCYLYVRVHMCIHVYSKIYRYNLIGLNHVVLCIFAGLIIWYWITGWWVFSEEDCLSSSQHSSATCSFVLI